MQNPVSVALEAGANWVLILFRWAACAFRRFRREGGQLIQLSLLDKFSYVVKHELGTYT